MTDFQFPSVPATGGGAPASDPTAVFGRRSLAWLIDFAIYFALMFGMFALTAEYKDLDEARGEALAAAIESGDVTIDMTVCEAFQTLDEVSTCVQFNDRLYFGSPTDQLLQIVVALAYFVFFVVIQGVAGGSPGKLITGLRVVRDDGQLAGIGKSAIRTLLWVVDGIPCVPVVALVTGLTSTGHQRVGDRAASTYVVGKSSVGVPPVAAAVGFAATGPVPAAAGWNAPPVDPNAGQPWTAQPPPASPLDDQTVMSTPMPSFDPPPTVDPPAPSPMDDQTVIGAYTPPPVTPPPVEPAPEMIDQTIARPFTAPEEATPPPVEPAPEMIDQTIARPFSAPEEVPPVEPSAEMVDHTIARPFSAPDEPVAPPPEDTSPPSWQPPTPAVEPDPPVVEHAPPVVPAPPVAEPEPPAVAPEPPVAEPPAADPVADAPAWDDADQTVIFDRQAIADLRAQAEPAEPAQPAAAPITPQPEAVPQPAAEPPALQQQPAVQQPVAQQPAQQAPPPQWDQARNTYIQWDPNSQQWLQWDAAGERWKPIDT